MTRAALLIAAMFFTAITGHIATKAIANAAYTQHEWTKR
jgi:multisubunit Na+/H+ antiporter MnhG subunit